MIQAFSIYNTSILVATIILHICIVLGLAIISIKPLRNWFTSQKIGIWFQHNALLLAWVLVLVATLGSLTYSNIFMINPCVLCWWQRIMMYPLLIVLGIPVFIKRHTVSKIIPLTLAIIGAIFGIYHYLIQMGAPSIQALCGAAEGASCTGRAVFLGGYITIPLMSLSIFITVIILISIYRKK